jgi:hypothetical protein
MILRGRAGGGLSNGGNIGFSTNAGEATESLEPGASA